MDWSVQPWPGGGYVIVLNGHAPIPAVFERREEAAHIAAQMALRRALMPPPGPVPHTPLAETEQAPALVP